MKILFLINDIGAHGGIERVTIVKANAFAEFGGGKNQVYISYIKKSSVETIHPISEKVNLYDLECHFKDFTAKNWFYNQLQLRKRVKCLIEKVQPDVVISTGQQERYALMSIRLKKAIKIREYHFNSNYREFWGNLGLLSRMSEWFEYNVLGNMYDMNYLLTKEDKETWFRRNPKFDYQYNPCSFHIPEVLPEYNRQNIVVTVGRLGEEKNYSSVIKAWSMINTEGWKLRLIGDGYERGMLENLAKELNVEETVEFMGFRNDVQQQLESCKILAMTSKYEGWGLNIIEAMSRGVVPCCYRTPYGPSDIITDGENGVLCKYLDENEFADKLSKLMQDDEEIRKLSINAHKRSKDFIPEKISEEWMTKYKDLLSIKRNK